MQQPPTLKLIAIFVCTQIASLLLLVPGIPVCLALSLGLDFTKAQPLHWPRWAWIWDNEIDGVCPKWYLDANPKRPRWLCAFMWAGLRNYANNLRFVPGVSQVGRPLWRKTWGPKPGGFYVQAGWEPPGYPVLSGGRNVNSW
jgi:hypothetical protein